MKAAIQERYNAARNGLDGGDQVFIRLASSGREYAIVAIGLTQHNIEAFAGEGNIRMLFDPEDLIGVRTVERGDG